MTTLQKPVSQQDQEKQKDPHLCKQEVQLTSQSEQEQEDQAHKTQSEADVIKSSTGVTSTANSQNVSCEDIQLVQNLIERCLRLYMNQGEVIKTLLNQAKIEPGFTSLDLGSLGSYSGSPFLQPDTEVFLESPDIDEIDEEFFLDSITEPCSQSDEDKEE